MAIPKIDKKFIDEALNYIDKNGVPPHNQSVKFDLLSEDGKKYPPKYVIAVAKHLAFGVEISTEGYDAGEANNSLQKLGFTIETRPGKTETDDQEENVHLSELERFSSMLRNSKNIIFHGAPGTGKTYLAREIAAYIISKGQCIIYDDLSDEQKQQVAFVQFHPSYDYTDFVEGLRPTVNDDGTMGFELQDGIFKKFVVRARKNYEKSEAELEKEDSIDEAMDEFFSSIEPGEDTFETVSHHNPFTIISFDENRINISIPANQTVNKFSMRVDELRRLLESDNNFTMSKEISAFFKRSVRQIDSYYFALYLKIKEIMKKKGVSSKESKPRERNDYIFIIDEINRGEISKIFGELFFAIEPSYRGKKGDISTQYANMHSDPNEKFHIPENVYIIGTMNDIDRSVDSFDFAMRRRFRFVELKAGDRVGMLDSLEDNALIDEARKRMTALNKNISDHLNDNYQIGPSYFLKLDELDFDQLWTDYLQPLLQDYIQGMPDEKGIMEQFEEAYGYKKPTKDDANGAAKD